MIRPALGPLVLFAGLLSVSAAAWTKEPPKERMVQKEISGEVVAFTRRTLSVETNQTAGNPEEMLFPVNPASVKFERIKAFTDLQRGDRVRVEYKQTFREDDQGAERLVGTVATKIILLANKATGLQSQSAEAGP